MLVQLSAHHPPTNHWLSSPLPLVSFPLQPGCPPQSSFPVIRTPHWLSSHTQLPVLLTGCPPYFSTGFSPPGCPPHSPLAVLLTPHWLSSRSPLTVRPAPHWLSSPHHIGCTPRSSVTVLPIPYWLSSPHHTGCTPRSSLTVLPTPH